MEGVIFTEQADSDLFGIYVYTYQTWGEAQAIKYTNDLKTAMSKVACNPTLLGKRRDKIRPGYFSYHVGRHLFFYRIADEGIEIVRILHDSMDVKRHFPDEVS